jgi:glycosyltransferase involved in cell wall biosynthesis
MLAQFYPPVMGGLELHVRNLAHGLAARGHEVSVATLRQEGQAATELDGPVRLHRVDGWIQRLPMLFTPGIPRSATPLPDPGVVAALRGIVKTARPDVVHAHNWLGYSYLPLGAFARRPLVVSLHNYGLSCAKHDLIRGERPCSGPGFAKCLRCAAGHYGTVRGTATCVSMWAMDPLQRRVVDHILPVSEDVVRGNRLEAYGVPYTVVPNFVPDDIVEPTADAPGAAAQLPDGPYLLFVGAFGRHKGLDVLFDAYRLLAKPPQLVLIGFNARDSGELLAGAPPGTIVYHSWPHGAVMEAWRRSAVGVVPSVWREPCPTVVIESMAAGVPLVASAVGGIPELVEDGVTGLLTPPGDAGALAAGLHRLLDDEPLRQRLSAAARVRAERFRAAVIVPQVEDVYRSAIDGRARGHRRLPPVAGE